MARHRHIGGMIGIVCFALLAAGCSRGSPGVTVATAASGSITTDAGGFGTVSAAIDVPLAFSFSDRVENVLVEPGQQVTKGQSLLTLDPRPLLANVAVLRAHLQGVETDLARVQGDLAKASSALRPTLLDNEQILQSQASLYSQLLAKAQGQSNTVTSPINGQVLAVNVLSGQVARSGSTLVELVDYHRIRVTVELPVSAQQNIRPGNTAKLTFGALPGLTITGTVSSVSPGSINSGTGFQLTVDAPNTPDLRIHPGYQAYAQVPFSSPAGTVVRRMAVLNAGLAPVIFVVTNNVVQLRHVQVGAEDSSDAQVVTGIRPGEEYVLVGSQNLASGDHVRITADLGPLGGQSR
jgi:multidrug efflux system membrane fusion protein